MLIGFVTTIAIIYRLSTKTNRRNNGDRANPWGQTCLDKRVAHFNPVEEYHDQVRTLRPYRAN
jgi:hypothetical protein